MGLRELLDKQQKRFGKGGKYESFAPLFDAADSFLYTTGRVTQRASHVRDFIDIKRVMITVVIALVPCIFMAFYNTGLQANLALTALGQTSSNDWRATVLSFWGIGTAADSFTANIVHGALYFLPVIAVTFAAGGFWEAVFAIMRKQEISEGFIVTSILFPLTLPPDIPLWQAALGISFGVVIGKEIFGGTGKNIFNPALTGRAFLFFAYPAQISGNSVWVAVDGLTRATPLAEAADPSLVLSVSWTEAFIGTIPGSMGETSALACLVGAALLIITGIGSWRIMVSTVAGMCVVTWILNIVGSTTNPMFSLSPAWHMVLGGFAFGTVYMTTDPVSGAITNHGKYIYGFLIGVLTALIRIVNPAFPEGIMLAILFANMFAPIIDRIFVDININRRLMKNAR